MANPPFSNVVLLLHCDGTNGSTTFTDSSNYSRTPSEINSPAQISTAQSKFNGASASFNGTYPGDVRYADSSDFDFGSGDFTIEFWFRANTVNEYQQGLLVKTNANPYGPYLFFLNASTLVIRSTNLTERQFANIAINTWYHVAISRTGTAINYFLDGNLTFTTTTSNALYTNTNPVCIGSFGPGGSYGFNGYLEEIRFTKGTGNYTASFTPATEAFPDSSVENHIALQGAITLTGQQPSLSVGWINTASLGTINLTGQQADKIIGMAVTGSQGQITLTGQQPGFINRSLKAIAPDWVATRYQCFLDDLELPISSFQTRLTSTTTYLAIVIKGVDAWIDEIIARNGGALSIYRIYDYLDGSSASFFIASALFDTLQTSQGARSGTTGTLSGSENMAIVTPITLQLTGAVTRSYDSGGIRYRCKIDPRAKPLDTVTINGETFVLESVIHIIDTKTSIMEIKEKLA